MDSKAHLLLQTYNFPEKIYYTLLEKIERYKDVDIELFGDLLNVIRDLRNKNLSLQEENIKYKEDIKSYEKIIKENEDTAGEK